MDNKIKLAALKALLEERLVRVNDALGEQSEDEEPCDCCEGPVQVTSTCPVNLGARIQWFRHHLDVWEESIAQMDKDGRSTTASAVVHELIDDFAETFDDIIHEA